MARPRQYDQPISVPFTFEVKERIERLASTYPVAQADVVRACVDGSLDSVENQLKEKHP